MGQGMGQLADDHDPAEIGHLRRDPHPAAVFAHPAVGGDHQRRGEHGAVVQPHPAFARVGLDAGYRALGQDGDRIGVAHCLVGGLADQMVGHELAEIGSAAVFGGEVQRVRIGAVEHLGVADGANLVLRDMAPETEVFHQCLGGVGERDVAPILGRVLQHRERLALDHHHAQPGIGQCPREAQPRRARADDDDIVLLCAVGHGWLPLAVACKMS